MSLAERILNRPPKRRADAAAKQLAKAEQAHAEAQQAVQAAHQTHVTEMAKQPTIVGLRGAQERATKAAQALDEAKRAHVDARIADAEARRAEAEDQIENALGKLGEIVDLADALDTELTAASREKVTAEAELRQLRADPSTPAHAPALALEARVGHGARHYRIKQLINEKRAFGARWLLDH